MPPAQIDPSRGSRRQTRGRAALAHVFRLVTWLCVPALLSAGCADEQGGGDAPKPDAAGDTRDADAAASLLRRTDGPAGCGTANAWYFGNPTQPKSAVLCPTPCAALNAGASIAMLIGCRTVILARR